MQSKLYVGNLSYSVTEDDLKTLFEECGAVNSVTIIKDNYSGNSKGFGFVEMGTQVEAEKALSKDGFLFMGRNIKVSVARPQQKRDDRGGHHKGGSSSGRSGGFGRNRY